jgi:hypothetical protein
LLNRLKFIVHGTHLLFWTCQSYRPIPSKFLRLTQGVQAES